MTDRSKIPSRVSLAAALVLAAAFAVPLALRFDPAALEAPSFPFGDEALLEIATARAQNFQQLVGPYSRFHWSHPGPLYFYWLAPFRAWLGPHYASLLAGALALTAVTGAAAIGCAARAGGATAGLAMLAGLAVLFAGPGFETVSAWNPLVTVAPFALHIVLASGIAAGRSAWLPAEALVASFLIQTHVGTAPAVAITLAAALAIERFSRGRGSPGSRAAWLGFAVVLAAVWLPPAYGELRPGGGNLSKLAAFFSAASGPQRGLVEAAVIAFEQVGAWAAVPGSSLMLASATILLLPVGAWSGWRKSRSFAAALSILALLAIAMATLSVRQIVGEPYPYLLAWIAVLGPVSAAAFVSAVAPDGGASISAKRAVAAGVAAIAALHVVAQAELPRIADVDDARTRRLSGAVLDYLHGHGLSRPLVRILSPDAWIPTSGVVLQLQRAGFTVEVAEPWTFAFGGAMAARGGHDATLVITDDTRLTTSRFFDRIATAGDVTAYASPRRSAEETLLAELEIDPDDYPSLLALRALYGGANDAARGAEVERRLAALKPKVASQIRFGDDLELAGYDVVRIAPRRLRIVLLWHALRPMVWEYASFLHFEGAGVRFQDDHFLGGPGRTTPAWNSGDFVREEREVAVPDDAPPGAYSIRIGVWAPKEAIRLRVGDAKDTELAAFDL